MKEKKSIAILAGGTSSEREISLQSAQLIVDHIDRNTYTPRLLLVNEGQILDAQTKIVLDLTTFSLRLDDQDLTFDYAFLIVHGPPCENGLLQGYLEFLNIPHNTCDSLVAGITFNKAYCKDLLRTIDIPMAESILLYAQGPSRLSEIRSMGFPVFVKPNQHGSSYGITKVNAQTDLEPAIELAFSFDSEVLVERFIHGIEYSCGVLESAGQIHTFPITEIRPDGEFFDYDAKYLGKSQEITPANLPQDLTAVCQERSARIYKHLQCKGIVRFDYILEDGEFYFLEVNTIPGMSPASIIPQQALSYGWEISQLISNIIENTI